MGARMTREQLKEGVRTQIRDLVVKLSAGCEEKEIPEVVQIVSTFGDAKFALKHKYGVNLKDITTGTGLEMLEGDWSTTGKLIIGTKAKSLVVEKGERIVKESARIAVMCPAFDVEDLRRLKLLLEVERNL